MNAHEKRLYWLGLADPWLFADVDRLLDKGEAYFDWALARLKPATWSDALEPSILLAVLAAVDAYLANPLLREDVELAVHACNKHIDLWSGLRS